MAAHEKYADALAHAAADSAVYEDSLYRAGDALYRQAATVDGVDTARFVDLSAQAEILMKQYLSRPARASVDPEAVKRRMVAQWRTKDYAAMQREAAWFQTDEGSLDGEAKAYCGIALFKASEDLVSERARSDQAETMKSTGRNILMECAKDESVRNTRQMVEGYYYLGDYASQKDAAIKNLELVKSTDALARAEMMIYAGIALIYQKPQDTEGALKYLDGALAEYDKDPATVGLCAATAARWAFIVMRDHQDAVGMQKYHDKLLTMPDCRSKKRTIDEYRRILNR